MKKFRLRSASKTLGAVLSTVLVVTAVPVTSFAAPDTESVSDDYELVWEENFDGEGLNTDDWNVEQHEPGWVNAELQRYTALDEGNIVVDGGVLSIKPQYTKEEVSEENAAEDSEAQVKETVVSFDFEYSGETKDTTTLQINFGVIGDGYQETSTAAKVEISSVSFVDDTDSENPVVIAGSFSDAEGWFGGAQGDGAGSVSYEDGKAIIEITNPGSENWHFQIQKAGFTLEDGHKYKFEMVASSNVDRAVELSVLDNTSWNWHGGTKALIEGSGAVAGGASGSGKSEITSGRITTQGKHDFTYGRFEARAKVPAGQGYLPAFWLMASDEGLYGQWPRCGEIDIMEVKGQDIGTSFHTIHYGYSSGTGHKENQGSNSFSDGNLADEYHVYRVDWDPGIITWYVDDEEVYSTSDWYTGTDDDNQVTYPAPFDQDFYIILNLAVGGSWVGYPDDEVYEQMNDQSYDIDYVKVYQRSAEAYEKLESECKKPDAPQVTFREADESGNYVINGDFGREIGIDGKADADDNNWKFHLESDGKGSEYVLSDKGITVTQSTIGSQNYSVQLKQGNIPMYKGWEYELTFDAVAKEERDIVVDVEGPDKGWIRYLNDTTVKVGTTKQSYSYTFTMNEKTDPNGCLEFNFGKLGSTAAVTISNVRLTHKSGETAVDDGAKEIRPDGNYIYNGGFDQGEKRLGYWEFSDEDSQYISVTNSKNTRELKVVVPENRTVTIGQSKLAPLVKGEYELSFKAGREGGAADAVTFEVSGKTYKPELTDADQSYAKKFYFDTDNDRAGSYVKLTFDKPGTYYVDDVFLCESALIKNGSFNAGLAGFSPYIYDTVKANYVIDSMNGNDNAFAITIEDTMADDAGNSWYVQLNQDGVTLEEGKSYRLSFRAKSSIARKISYAMQEFEGNWTNYSGTGAVDIDNEWKTFTADFKMNYSTDTATRFNITMGSVEGIRITEKHDVFIDDISLIEIDEAGSQTEEPSDPDQPGEDEPSDPQPGTEPGTDEPADPDQPGTTDPDQPGVEPGTEDPGNQPGVEPGTDNPTDEPAVEPDKPTEPEKPSYNPSPIIKIIEPVVKVVVKVVKTVVSFLKRLFW